MTDTEHGFEPKWTPGKWTVYNGNVWAGGDPEVDGIPLIHTHRQRGGIGATDWAHGHPRVTRQADAELISLAPELAAAVLELDKWDCQCEAPYDRLHHSKLDCAYMRDLAQRLRMIGADE